MQQELREQKQLQIYIQITLLSTQYKHDQQQHAEVKYSYIHLPELIYIVPFCWKLRLEAILIWSQDSFSITIHHAPDE